MSHEVKAPMPGTIVDIFVAEGDNVEEYQEIIVLESMKMENPIPTKIAGTVKTINVKKGDKVTANQVLIVVE